MFLLNFKERGREKDRERNIDVREKHKSYPSSANPGQGLNLQFTHVPYSGFKFSNFDAYGDAPINLVTQAGQSEYIFCSKVSVFG